MAMTENKFPLVGRLPNFDVNGGWASRGIAGSFAAARAYAKWFVNGDEEDLKLFENLNVTGLRSSLESTIPHPNTRGETSEFPVLRQ
jgi:glycine/D-amino acid oxidase-like deaminating enzyme